VSSSNPGSVRSIIEAATRAPSVHNTQPWRFVAGPTTIDVYADPSRMLNVIDPDGRELHISCGAALAFAEVAAHAAGRSCEVQLLPESAGGDQLARLELGGERTAAPEDLALAEAIPRRYTERGRFEDRPVPGWLVDELVGAAARFGVWTRVLDRPEQAVATAVLLAHADEIERANPEYQQELRAWSRSDSAPEGVPRSAVPSTPVSRRGSSFRLRDFDVSEPAADAAEEPPPSEHPLVLLLGTPADDPTSWLQAGRATARVLLRAAADDVAASPMTQVLEVPLARAALARELGLLGHPQMLLRFGYAHGHPTAGRRPVEEVTAYSAEPRGER
jgi:hypothetical protein